MFIQKRINDTTKMTQSKPILTIGILFLVLITGCPQPQLDLEMAIEVISVWEQDACSDEYRVKNVSPRVLANGSLECLVYRGNITEFKGKFVERDEGGSTIVKGERCYFQIPIDEIIKEMFKDVEPTIIVWDTYYNSSDLVNVSCFEVYNETK